MPTITMRSSCARCPRTPNRMSSELCSMSWRNAMPARGSAWKTEYANRPSPARVTTIASARSAWGTEKTRSHANQRDEGLSCEFICIAFAAQLPRMNCPGHAPAYHPRLGRSGAPGFGIRPASCAVVCAEPQSERQSHGDGATDQQRARAMCRIEMFIAGRRQVAIGNVGGKQDSLRFIGWRIRGLKTRGRNFGRDDHHLAFRQRYSIVSRTLLARILGHLAQR